MYTQNYGLISEYMRMVGLRWNDEAGTYAHRVAPQHEGGTISRYALVPTPAMFNQVELNVKLHKRIGEYLEPIKDDKERLITDEVLDALGRLRMELREISLDERWAVSKIPVPRHDYSLSPFFATRNTRSAAGAMVYIHSTWKSEFDMLLRGLSKVLNDGEESFNDWCISSAKALLGSQDKYKAPIQQFKKVIESINRATPTAQLNNMAMNDSESTVIDYMGNEIPAKEAFVLTRESGHEGEYIRMEDAYMKEVWTYGDEDLICITQEEADMYIRQLVSRDEVHIGTCENDIVWLDGGNYSGYYAWRDDSIYCEQNNWYYHIDDENEHVFYNERTGEYQLDCPEASVRHEYHHGFRKDYTTNDTLFSIGFEVEKEDGDVLYDWDLDDIDDTDWCREEDASLDDATGFELVSPVFDLLDNKIDEQLKSSNVLRDHINADVSSHCGGHINFGMKGIDGRDLFDKIQAYVPLFLTIYRHRLGNTYSQIKRKPDDYKRGGRYSAVHVKGSYIEIRVPSAVKNVNNLLWRRDLMRIIAGNLNTKPLQVITAMLSPKTPLGKHLRKVYTSDEQIHKIVSIYAQFADDMYSSFSFTSDGAGVFIKSAVRRLKNRKVKGTTIVSYTNEATDRLRNTFGRSYITEAQGTLHFVDDLLND